MKDNIKKNIKEEIAASLKPNPPLRIISQRNLNRIFFIFLIVAAFVAGYFQSKYQTENRKYFNFEDKYIRLRYMIGENNSDQLIKQSYQYIDRNGVEIQIINRE